MNRSGLALVFVLSAAVPLVGLSGSVMTGGEIERPGSGKGRIVLINAQGKVKDRDIDCVRSEIDSELNCRVEVVKTSIGVDFRRMKEDLGASVAVFIVDDATHPVSLVALEDRWALVNVARIPEDVVAKEILRTFAVVSGGYVSQFPNTLMSVTNAAALKEAELYVTPDVCMRQKTFLESIGVTPVETVSYGIACQEGWAPAPTNDVQKSIWDKVHTPPSKPLKIQYDPAAQKGKVTK